MCKSTDLKILNGRIENDELGGVTFFNSRGCSLIDYLLCRSDLINTIADFRISEFTTNHIFYN